MSSALSVNLGNMSRTANTGIVLLLIFFGLAGSFVSFYFHFLTVPLFLFVMLNVYWRHGQKSHTLLANFGFLAQFRYLFESIGPEFRQYLFASDVEERPFNRIERAEVYRKSKGIDSMSAFGTLLEYNREEIKLLHSFYPLSHEHLNSFDIAVGAARGLDSTYHIQKPIMISAMSYGALGQNAVRALARGAKLAGAIMNTGEGGFPKYHLMEGCDLIFQMGTAKFGVRTRLGELDESKLSSLSAKEQVKMIEIKFSQGAKPGKGGFLPKEKITAEIAELRGVPLGEDVISPPHHTECVDAATTVAFIRRIQEVSGLPTGIKFCLGRPDEFRELVGEMKKQDIVPDFISVDGGEGGTGAAPKSFMDNLGLPLFHALPIVQKIMLDSGLRDRLAIFASGKLVSPGKQLTALSLGADAVYSARGFLFSLGCIQALQCHSNTCPAGITTHQTQLQQGLDIDNKAHRVANYINAITKDHEDLLAAMGASSAGLLTKGNVYMTEEGSSFASGRELL